MTISRKLHCLLIYVKFHAIPRKYGNSAANGKFRRLARNSAAHGKVWSLLKSILFISFHQQIYYPIKTLNTAMSVSCYLFTLQIVVLSNKSINKINRQNCYKSYACAEAPINRLAPNSE